MVSPGKLRGSGILQEPYFAFKRSLTIYGGAIHPFVSYVVNLYRGLTSLSINTLTVCPKMMKPIDYITIHPLLVPSYL